MENLNIDLSCCVRLAKLAYTNKDIVAEYAVLFKSNPVSVETVSDDSLTGTRVYVMKNKTTLFFAIRGANIISRVEKDAQLPFLDVICSNGFPRNKYNNLKVHGNFLKQFTSVKFQLMDIINDHKEAGITNIMFIGHSFGGAVATLAAACCKSHYPKYNVSCITFGSPRVGNKQFSEYFNDIINCSKRVVYGDDILTKVPYYFYKHVGGKVEIGDRSSSIFRRHYGTLSDSGIDKYVDYILN